MRATAPPADRRAAWLLNAALIVVVVWQLLAFVSVAMQRNLEFDGGMNLEVAKSIANGDGPRGRYHLEEFYPYGVQSKEPFYLVGAAVFKVAGVGPVQAQATNLVFLFALVLLAVCVVARAMKAWCAGLLAAVFMLAIPRMTFYSMMGYGEIATMCFGLGALAVLAWPTRLDAADWKRPFFAGALGALAIATKVVGVVQFAAIAMVLVLRVAADAEPGTVLRAWIRAGIAFVAGALVPLLAFEAWRLFWLGQADYIAWWQLQISRIGNQSGAAPRLDQTHSLQMVERLGVLAREIGVGMTTTIALLVVPLVAGVVALVRRFPRPAPDDATRTWLTLGLVLIAGAYIPWWLRIVPDDKVWMRYLLIALLALAMLAAMGLCSHLQAARRSTSIGGRVLHTVLAIALALVFIPFAWRSVPKTLDFSPGVDVQAVQYAAGVVSTLPKERTVFGFGWYAAPVVQLYSDRSFKDLTDWPIGLLTDQPEYVVADMHTFIVGVLNPLLARYPQRRLMRDNEYAQVYEIDFAHPFDPFTTQDASKALTNVDFAEHKDYPLVIGYAPYDPVGGRDAETDSEILLRYEGQPALEIAAYMGLQRFYLRPEPLRGRVLIGDCPAVRIAFEQPGWKLFRIPLTCRPVANENVRVRILLDNVINLPYEKIRQSAMLVRRIGFTR